MILEIDAATSLRLQFDPATTSTSCRTPQGSTLVIEIIGRQPQDLSWSKYIRSVRHAFRPHRDSGAQNMPPALIRSQHWPRSSRQAGGFAGSGFLVKGADKDGCLDPPLGKTLTRQGKRSTHHYRTSECGCIGGSPPGLAQTKKAISRSVVSMAPGKREKVGGVKRRRRYARFTV